MGTGITAIAGHTVGERIQTRPVPLGDGIDATTYARGVTTGNHDGETLGAGIDAVTDNNAGATSATEDPTLAVADAAEGAAIKFNVGAGICAVADIDTMKPDPETDSDKVGTDTCADTDRRAGTTQTCAGTGIDAPAEMLTNAPPGTNPGNGICALADSPAGVTQLIVGVGKLAVADNPADNINDNDTPVDADADSRAGIIHHITGEVSAEAANNVGDVKVMWPLSD